MGGLGDLLQKPLNTIDNVVNKAGDVANNGINRAGDLAEDGLNMFEGLLSSPMLLIGGAVVLLIMVNK
jgi:hypothetical protein